MADSSPLVNEPFYSDSLFDLYNSQALNQVADFLADPLDALNPKDVARQQIYETVIAAPSNNTELEEPNQLAGFPTATIDDDFFGNINDSIPKDRVCQRHRVPCNLVEYITRLQALNQPADFPTDHLDDEFFGAPSANGHILPQFHNQAADIPTASSSHFSGGLNSIYNSNTRLQSQNQAADDHFSRALDPNYGSFQRYYELAIAAPSGNSVVDGQTRPQAQYQAADDEFFGALNPNYGILQQYSELAIPAPSKDSVVDCSFLLQAQNQAAEFPTALNPNNGVRQQYYQPSIPGLRISTYLFARMPEKLRDA